MKTKKPLCVVCHEKPARIGRKQGFTANLVCSQKCALFEFLNRHMDSTQCEVCGEWLEVCGGCEEAA
jgi:hypothetical protein